MTATMNASTNGSPRKNLASQLDRLDHILDGLADALNESVAAAVKDAVTLAVQEAVRGILAEALTNPDVLAKLRGLVNVPVTAFSVPVTVVAPVVRKSWLGKVAAKISAWCGRGWRSVRGACTSLFGRITNALSTAKHRLQIVRQFRVPLLTAVAVGTVAGLGAYWGGPYVAALAGWIAGFTTTLTVQAGIWLQSAFGSVYTD